MDKSDLFPVYSELIDFGAALSRIVAISHMWLFKYTLVKIK